MTGFSIPPFCRRELPLLFLVLTCRGNQAGDETTGYTRLTRATPIAWTEGDGAILIMRFDQLVAGDAGNVSCDSTGFYYVSLDGATKPVLVGLPACDLWNVTSFSLNPDRASLVYSDDLDGGSIGTLDLRSGDRETLMKGCTPFQNAPQWSPDGSRIAVALSCNGPDHEAQIHLITRQGDVRRLTPARSGERHSQPAWSPRGDRLGYVVRIGGQVDSIEILDVATGTTVRIAEGTSPSWSPDGQLIAFLQGKRNEERSVVVGVRPDGSGVTAMYRSNGSASIEGPLLWSSDGNQIAFAIRRSVWVTDREGKAVRLFPPS